MRLRLTALCFVVLAAGGCSSQQQSGAHAAATPAVPKNTIDFPLYPGASVIASHEYAQSVQAANAGNNSVFASGNGTYTGHEIIAASGAAFDDLSAWVSRLNAAPPAGYTALESGTNASERMQAHDYGLDYATFQTREGGKRRGLLVIVMDPQRVDEKFGRVLGMIARYRSLPQFMRSPIDSEAKARFGMTISQAMAPDSPVGAALAALNEFEHKNTRGIVLLDAVKR
jgi:hypothetical protein